jgi:hypothetical protein
MKKNIIYLVTAFFLFSCNSWKEQLKQKGTKDEARINAILDFANSNKLSRNKTIVIDSYEETKDLYCFKFYKNEKVLPGHKPLKPR